MASQFAGTPNSEGTRAIGPFHVAYVIINISGPFLWRADVNDNTMPDQLTLSLLGTGSLPDLLRGTIKANLIHHLAHAGTRTELAVLGRSWRPPYDWLPKRACPPSAEVVSEFTRLCGVATGDLKESDLNPLRAIAEREPEQLWAWVGIGLTALRVWNGDGGFRLAKSCFERAASLRPEWAWGPLLVGEAQRSLLDYEGALAGYRRAFSLDPKLSWAPAFLARVYFQIGTQAGPLGLMDQAIFLSPREGWMHAWRAEGLRRLGRPQEAHRAFSRALKLDPKYDQAYVWRGKLLMEEGRPAEAVKSLRRGLKLCPQFEKGWRALSAALRQCGRIREALAALNRAAALNHRNNWLGNWLVEGSAPEGGARKSLVQLEEFVRKNPSDALARAWLGETLTQLGRPADGLAQIERALSVNPKLAWPKAWKGEALLALGKNSQAIPALEEASSADPEYGRAWAWLGRARADQGDWKSALEALTRAQTARRVEYSWIYAWRGEALLALGDGRAALSEFDAAVGLDPGRAAFRSLRGKALVAVGDISRGSLELLRAEADPFWGELALAEEDRRGGRFRDADRRLTPLVRRRREGFLHLLRHRVRVEGKLPGALRDVDIAFRRDPACGWLFGMNPLPESAPLGYALLQDAAFAARPESAAAWAYHGHGLLQAGKKPQGQEALRKAAELEPAGWILAWHGEALRKTGDAQAALQTLRRATEADPRYANAWAWLGASLLAAGEAEEAERALSKAIALRSTAQAHLDRFRARRALGNWTSALDDLDRASGLNWELSWDRDPAVQLREASAASKRDPRATVWTAEAHLRSGRPAEALGLLRKKRLGGRRAGNLGRSIEAMALLALGRNEEARRSVDGTPIQGPGLNRLLVARAETGLALGRPDDSLQPAAQALRREPYSARLHLLRARARAAAGRRSQSQSDCRGALRLCPGFPEAAALLQTLERGPHTGVHGSLEFFTNYSCNAKCPFCFNPPDASPALERGLPFEELAKRIYAGRREGFEEVKFIGGEPTIRDDFPSLVALARRVGFRRIQLTTNGVRLGDPGYAARAARLGLTHVRFSIHGHRPDIHDRMVGVPGALTRIRSAARTLRALGVSLGVNHVINAENYRSLPETAVWLWENLGLRDAIFYFLRFQGYAQVPANHARIALRMSEAAPQVEEAFRRLRARGHRIMPALIHFPPCSLPKLAAHMLDWSKEGDPSRLTLPDGTSAAVEEATNNGKIQIPACRTCDLRSRCLGVERGYLAIYGDSEFQPIRASTSRPAAVAVSR